MRRLACCVVALLALVAGRASAQVRTDGPTSVNCVQGCSGGTTATDNGTITAGQSTGLSLALEQFYDGAAWKRAFGGTLANGVANPTTVWVGSFPFIWNGATWDRWNGHIVCDSGCGSPAATADNSAFTFGTTSVSPIAFVVDDVATNSVTENSFGAARMSGTRILYVDLSKTGANATALKVDGSAVTQPVSGSVTADTELPAAAALADSTANPTVPGVGAFNNVFDGSNWYRQRGNANGTLVLGPVSPGSAIGTTSGLINGGFASAAAPTDVGADGQAVRAWHLRSGAYVTQPSYSGTIAVGGNGVAGAGVQRVTLASDSTGQVTLAAGANTIGTVTATQGGTWTVQPGNTANTTPWLTSIVGGGNTASVNASSQLAVNCANCTGSGVSQQDNTGFTPGSGNFVPSGFEVDDYLSSAAAEGSAGVARMSPSRIAYTDLSQDKSGLATLVQSLTVLVSDLHNDGLHSRGDREGYSIRGSFNSLVGSAGDSLKVYATNAPDPCASPTKFNASISQTTSTKIVSGQPGRRVFVCSVFVVGADAENLSIVEGTGAACGTGTLAVVGGTTAAAGPNFAANGGYQQGTGQGSIAVEAVGGNDLCVLQSGSGRVAGNITYTVY